jgi:hypothetical protein
MKSKFYLIAFFSLLMVTTSWAQSTTTATPATPPPPKPADHSYKPLTLKLNDDGSKYVRFIMWHQFWMTATQNNPDTRDVQGQLIDGSEGAEGAWSTDLALAPFALPGICPNFSPRHDPDPLGHQQPELYWWRNRTEWAQQQQRYRNQQRQKATAVHPRCLDGV